MHYKGGVTWKLEFTPAAERWFMGLSQVDAQRVSAALDRLERHGPGLGRPTVDTVKGSRHHNMKELRAVGGNIRLLFAFGPNRAGVVLVGGDKTNDWRGFYARAIPVADRRYDQHLRALREQDLVAVRAKTTTTKRPTDRNRGWQRTNRTRTGKPSAGREL